MSVWRLNNSRHHKSVHAPHVLADKIGTAPKMDYWVPLAQGPNWARNEHHTVHNASRISKARSTKQADSCEPPEGAERAECLISLPQRMGSASCKASGMFFKGADACCCPQEREKATSPFRERGKETSRLPSQERERGTSCRSPSRSPQTWWW